MRPLRVLYIYDETIADGVVLRLSISFSGCPHICFGCHNPDSHDPEKGVLLDSVLAAEIVNKVNTNPLLDGITLSGGDPMFNPEALLEFLKFLKEKTKKNIWCYTGYTYEQLLKDPLRSECLKYIDTLVDGPFIMALRDPSLSFRGSTNQRILPLKNGRAI